MNKWPGMSAQQVTGRTLIAWRDVQRKLSGGARKTFDVEKILAEPDPRKALDELPRSAARLASASSAATGFDRHAESRMRSAPSRQWQAPLGKKLRTTPCKVGA